MPADLPGDELPLAGVRVIDVGKFLAGPFAATLMGEFGAEVIKVEHPIGGDPMRCFGTATEAPDATLKWLSESRSKKSVTCDLLQPEGVALFLKRVARSDVRVENFCPGTFESWGLTCDKLSEANPRRALSCHRHAGRPAEQHRRPLRRPPVRCALQPGAEAGGAHRSNPARGAGLDAAKIAKLRATKAI